MRRGILKLITTKNNCKGITLLEVIIATTVIAVAFTAILGLVTQSIVAISETKKRTQASFLAQEAIEIAQNIRDTNYKQSKIPWDARLFVSSYSPWFKLPIPNAFDSSEGWTMINVTSADKTETIAPINGITFSRTIKIEKDTADPDNKRKITVNVSWGKGFVEESKTLTNWKAATAAVAGDPTLVCSSSDDTTITLGYTLNPLNVSATLVRDGTVTVSSGIILTPGSRTDSPLTAGTWYKYVLTDSLNKTATAYCATTAPPEISLIDSLSLNYTVFSMQTFIANNNVTVKGGIYSNNNLSITAGGEFYGNIYSASAAGGGVRSTFNGTLNFYNASKACIQGTALIAIGATVDPAGSIEGNCPGVPSYQAFTYDTAKVYNYINGLTDAGKKTSLAAGNITINSNTNWINAIIIGNLTIENNAVLKLKGNLYVTGSITITSGGIELDSSIADKNIIVVAKDGITINNDNGNAFVRNPSGAGRIVMINDDEIDPKRNFLVNANAVGKTYDFTKAIFISLKSHLNFNVTLSSALAAPHAIVGQDVSLNAATYIGDGTALPMLSFYTP